MKKKEQPIVIAQIMGKWVGGGVESVIMNYYRHIDRSKIQFDFICDEDSTNIPYEEIEQLGGRVILCPPYQKVFKYIKFLKKIFTENKYRIVHSNINTLSVFPLYAAKKAEVKIRIAHSHSTSNKKEWKKNIIKNILRLFSKKYANVYFACSELAGRYMFGNKAFNEGKVTVINNAIDLDEFKFDKNLRIKKRKELGISDSTLVVGHIGRFVAQKNHDFLIDIFNELHKKNNDSVLLLIGQGPKIDEIKNKVDNLKLNECVKFLGQRSDVKELYQAMDLFLFPSLYEGLGLVIVEAQATGLKCVASSEIPKCADISNKVDFISLEENPLKWADVCLKNDSFKRYDYDNNLINKYGFSIKNEANKLLNIYSDFNKTRVCHVVCGLAAGGVESMIYNYCSNIDATKFKWYMIYQHDPSQKNIDEFSKLNFDLKRIPSKAKHPISNFISTYRYLKTNKIDVVHCHMTLMNFIPLFAAKLLGIKIRISHSHNSDVRKKNVLKKTFESFLKHLSIKYANVYFACGEDAGKFMYGNREYTIIPNALDLNKFAYSDTKRKEIRDTYNIKNDEILIGHIGRFTIQKNHEFLIYVFNEIHKKNNNFKLMLIGDGELFSGIKNKVKELNLDDSVIFTGIVSNTNDYYSAFDIFVLPSLWEGLPVVSIEAQYSNIKFLVSNNVDKKALLLKTSETLSIDDKQKWVDSILKFKKNKRTNNEKLFTDKHLNIIKESKILSEKYNLKK